MAGVTLWAWERRCRRCRRIPGERHGEACRGTPDFGRVVMSPAVSVEEQLYWNGESLMKSDGRPVDYSIEGRSKFLRRVFVKLDRPEVHICDKVPFRPKPPFPD